MIDRYIKFLKRKGAFFLTVLSIIMMSIKILHLDLKILSDLGKNRSGTIRRTEVVYSLK